jgi:hypothetical protein
MYTFALATMVSCGPSTLFIGGFDPLSDASSDGARNEDSALPEDASVPTLPDAAAVCPAFIGDAAATLITPLREPSCHACAMASCCSAVTACFLDDGDAGVHCALYARCIDECRFASVGLDGGLSPDGAGDAAVPNCELACSHLGGSTLYSELELCATVTCSCPPF